LSWPCTRVLEVGHEPAGARVQRVDDHLAIDGAGDLHATIPVVGRSGRDLPVALADRLGLGEEVERLARSDPRAALRPRVEQLAAASLEAIVQRAHERQRVVGEHAVDRRGGEDVDGHGFLPWMDAARTSIG
jgi:hypothetical protein